MEIFILNYDFISAKQKQKLFGFFLFFLYFLFLGVFIFMLLNCQNYNGFFKQLLKKFKLKEYHVWKLTWPAVIFCTILVPLCIMVYQATMAWYQLVRIIQHVLDN